jgi:hypothetical protein
MSLVIESGWLEQVDRGADNPTSYIPNHHETRKGGQGPVQSCSATDDDDVVYSNTGGYASTITHIKHTHMYYRNNANSAAHKDRWFTIGRSRVQIAVRSLAEMTEILCGFPQTVHGHAEIVP